MEILLAINSGWGEWAPNRQQPKRINTEVFFTLGAEGQRGFFSPRRSLKIKCTVDHGRRQGEVKKKPGELYLHPLGEHPDTLKEDLLFKYENGGGLREVTRGGGGRLKRRGGVWAVGRREYPYQQRDLATR